MRPENEVVRAGGCASNGSRICRSEDSLFLFSVLFDLPLTADWCCRRKRRLIYNVSVSTVLLRGGAGSPITSAVLATCLPLGRNASKLTRNQASNGPPLCLHRVRRDVAPFLESFLEILMKLFRVP